MIFKFLDSLGESLAKGEAEGQPWARIVIAIMTRIFYAFATFVTISAFLLMSFKWYPVPYMLSESLFSSGALMGILVISVLGSFLYPLYGKWYDERWKNK